MIPRRVLALATVAIAALANGGCTDFDPADGKSGPATSPSAAEAILARSIAFHDPEGRWGSRPVEMTWAGTGADDQERLRLDTTFFPDGESFEMNGHYRDVQIEYRVRGGEVAVRVDGESDLDAETREKLALEREDGLFWRNYFGFLAGFPLNLRDPGAIVDPEPRRVEFMGRPVDALGVSYDPEVGSDTWTFYFDPESAQLVGCRFTKADPSKPGEYMVFDGLIEAEGLRLPQQRRWYTSDDDGYLGSDTITRLAVR